MRSLVLKVSTQYRMLIEMLQEREAHPYNNYEMLKKFNVSFLKLNL